MTLVLFFWLLEFEIWGWGPALNGVSTLRFQTAHPAGAEVFQRRVETPFKAGFTFSDIELNAGISIDNNICFFKTGEALPSLKAGLWAFHGTTAYWVIWPSAELDSTR